jgi:predicted nucleic acid-binding protein
MTGFLLDTNCISEVVRVQPDPKIVRWMDATDEQQLYLSVLVLGEIRKGATALPASARRSQLEHWLDVDLPARFQGRILNIDAAVADTWGAIAGAARVQGVTLAVIDGLIAATALHHGLSIVTRNVRHFANVGVTLINPWE